MKVVWMGIALAAFVALFVFGRSSVLHIDDVTEANVMSLKTFRKDVSGVTLHLRGKLEGEAYVFAGNWDKQKLTGDVDWKVYHDWFQPTCLLQYVPTTVTSGSLTVEYQFH